LKRTSGRRNFIQKASLGLSSMVISTFLGSNNEPFSAIHTDAKKLNIVCIGAHPGDPEFGCGGTMAKYANAGHSVTFLYLTRGEAGDPSKSYAESAAIRTKEAENACKILHAKGVYAGQIDGNTILSKEKNDEIGRLISSENPDLVFTQWPMDSHPDHQVTGMLGLTAWIRSSRKFQLYFYEVNTGSETMAFTPTDYVDITNVREQKIAAMYSHLSQDPDGTYKNYFKPLEEFRGLECGVKAAEAFIQFKDKIERATIPGLTVDR
jgi:LmbE family N-acetylglucosaminyl deacetylase